MGFYQLEPLFYLFIIIGLFYANGLLLTRNFFSSSLWTEKFFVTSVVGIGSCILLLFLLALIGFLTPVMVIVLFSIAPAYLLRTNNKNKPFFTFNTTYQGIIQHAGIITIILLLLFTDSYPVFFPETSSDAMRYHLPYARFYAENHGLAVNEFLRYPVFTHNVNLIFSLGYLFENKNQGDVLARLFNIYFMTLLLLGLYSLTLKNFGKITAFIACLIFIKVKMLRVIMVSAYVDIALSLFIFACVYFMYLWQKTKQRHWLTLSAFILGIALGTKYLALVWLLPLTAWVFFTCKNSKLTGKFFFTALLFGSPWYIRNIILAGNPIHPFAQDVFGFWIWTASDIVAQKKELLTAFGVEKSLFNLIRLPWLLGTESVFVKSHLGWLLIAGIPLLGLAYKMEKFFKHMAVFIIFSLIFWFYSAQLLRYFTVSIPFLAIFSAYPLGQLFDRNDKIKFFSRPVVKTILAACLLMYSSVSLYYEFHINNTERPLPQSNHDWENILFKHDNYYPFAKILNAKNVSRVLNIGKTRINYTFDGFVLGDWFGLANFYTIATSAKNVDDIIQHMHRLKADYIIIEKKPAWANRINNLLKPSNRFEIIKDTELRTLYFFKP
jgi:hypothetical protein